MKGLSAQILPEVDLTAGEGLPDDRRFAITHGTSSFGTSAPEWRPKKDFLQLARNERLAALETTCHSATGILTIRRNGRQVARGQDTNPTGRLLINQFFAAYMKGEVPGTPCLVEAPGVMFSDTREKYVSILNAASVADIERVVNAPVDPVRFRADLLLDGLEPWAEAKWVGHRSLLATRFWKSWNRSDAAPRPRSTRPPRPAISTFPGSPARIFPSQLRRLCPRRPRAGGSRRVTRPV